eukprot:g1843.t1
MLVPKARGSSLTSQSSAEQPSGLDKASSHGPVVAVQRPTRSVFSRISAVAISMWSRRLRKSKVFGLKAQESQEAEKDALDDGTTWSWRRSKPCALCAWWTGHRRALGQCFALKNVFNGWIFASSVCFSLSSINLLNAFDHLDGAFIKLVSQVKLPAAALVSTFVLRKRYSLSQWLTMLIICCACACFTALAAEAAGEASRSAGCRGKRVMRYFFLHWDATTLWVLAGHFADIWMTAFMVVQLSSVSKYVAKCITMVVLFGINIWKGYCSCNLQQVLVAAIVILATLQFSSLGSERTRKERLEGSTAESRRKCSRVVEFRAGVPRA